MNKVRGCGAECGDGKLWGIARRKSTSSWMDGRSRAFGWRAGRKTYLGSAPSSSCSSSPSCGMIDDGINISRICRDLHPWGWSVRRARALAGRPRRAPRSRHTLVGRLDKRKTFSDAKEGYRPRPARRAISLVPLPYPRAQCAKNNATITDHYSSTSGTPLAPLEQTSARAASK